MKQFEIATWMRTETDRNLWKKWGGEGLHPAVNLKLLNMLMNLLFRIQGPRDRTFTLDTYR